jgi:hypothetical protein
MNINNLKQYGKLMQEIKLLNYDYNNTFDNNRYEYVTDTVSASDTEFPYIKRTLTIAGYAYDYTNEAEKKKIKNELLHKIKEKENKLSEIQGFINSIDDIIIRKIIEHRFINGYTWAKVGETIYGYPSPDVPYMSLKRYLEKMQNA